MPTCEAHVCVWGLGWRDRGRFVCCVASGHVVLCRGTREELVKGGSLGRLGGDDEGGLEKVGHFVFLSYVVDVVDVVVVAGS